MAGSKLGNLTDSDRELLRILTANSREPVTKIAGMLGIARSTVQERIERLKRQGVISKFTIVIDANSGGTEVAAWVRIQANLKDREQVARNVARIKAVRELYKVADEDDFLALISAKDTMAIDAVIGEIIAVGGVQRTRSKIMLVKIK